MKIIDIGVSCYPSGLSRTPLPKSTAHLRHRLGMDSTSVEFLFISLHLDAPSPYTGRKDIASVLDACVGECSVVEFNGILLGAQAEKTYRTSPAHTV